MILSPTSGSKFGSFGRVSLIHQIFLIHQMFMIKLIESHQVSHSEVGDLAEADSLLILSVVP